MMASKSSKSSKFAFSRTVSIPRMKSVPRKIIGIGRNYLAHAKELGNSVAESPKDMIIFLKPSTSFMRHSPTANIVLPRGADVHHEVELGVVIGKGGKHISPESAMQHVEGYCLALDMTSRNFQKASMALGQPWVRGKASDTFCAVGDFVPKSKVQGPVTLWLDVDGERRQHASTSLMIYSVEQLIAECSAVFTLEEGDLILSGTPAGVGPVVAGQKIRAGIEGLCEYQWGVVDEKI